MFPKWTQLGFGDPKQRNLGNSPLPCVSCKIISSLRSGHVGAVDRTPQGRTGAGGEPRHFLLSPHLPLAAQASCPMGKAPIPTLPVVLTASLMGGLPARPPSAAKVSLKHSFKGPHAVPALTPLSGRTRPLLGLAPVDSPLLFTWTICSHPSGSPAGRPSLSPVHLGEVFSASSLSSRPASSETPGRERFSLSWPPLPCRCQLAAEPSCAWTGVPSTPWGG